MADKSPRQAASAKSGKSIKEKRADKRAAAAPPSSLDKATATKAASPKRSDRFREPPQPRSPRQHAQT